MRTVRVGRNSIPTITNRTTIYSNGDADGVAEIVIPQVWLSDLVPYASITFKKHQREKNLNKSLF
jgi:hypothetical protein